MKSRIEAKRGNRAQPLTWFRYACGYSTGARSPPGQELNDPISGGLPVAPLTVGIRNELLWQIAISYWPFPSSAQERTSAGFLWAALSVYDPASLAVSPRLLLSVTAFHNKWYRL